MLSLVNPSVGAAMSSKIETGRTALRDQSKTVAV